MLYYPLGADNSMKLSKKGEKMGKKRDFGILVPLIFSVIFIFLGFSPFGISSKWFGYDLFLHIKPDVKEDDSILLITIDDTSIDNVGLWPWSRRIMADGLIAMREFDARYAVFDIEYVDNSPLAVDKNKLEKVIPVSFADEFQVIKDGISELGQALDDGRFSVSDLGYFLEEMLPYIDESEKRLYENVTDMVIDNDDYLGRAGKFFGNSFFTVRVLPEKLDRGRDFDSLKELVMENFSVRSVNPRKEVINPAVDIQPSVLKIISGAKGLGFPNINIDNDGVRRRLELVSGYRGNYILQLAFAAVLDSLGNPDLDIRRDRIILKNPKLPGAGKDIVIPLAEDGSMLLNWPKKKFKDSFGEHLSYWSLVLYRELENKLIIQLKEMEDEEFIYYYDKTISEVLDLYENTEKIRKSLLAGESEYSIEDYRKTRGVIFAEAAK